MKKRKGSHLIWALVAVLVCLGVFFGIRYSFYESFDAVSTNHIPVSNNELQEGIPPETTSDNQSQAEKTPYPIGLVTIKDISGAVLSQTPVPVVSGGWVALPVKSCYGGYNWSFSDELDKQDRQIRIEWGILHDYDQVGLWWLEGDQQIKGPELAPWSSEKPLNWVSILSHHEPIPVNTEEYTEQGYFAEIAVSEEQSEPGVFMQADRVVGWSFGQTIPGGYLWMGREGRELTYDLRVDDFYRFTFAGTREEAFALALGRKDYTHADMLAALAEGLRMESRIPASSVPSHLRLEPVIRRMHSIVTQLISDEDYQAVAEILDAQILIQMQNPSLLADVAYSVMKTSGYENAAWLMEDVRKYMPLDQGTETIRANRLHVDLYQGWLSELMTDGRISRAALVLDTAKAFFPNDPTLHLWGVRLALENKDWREAQRLLDERQYPMSLQDRANNLAEQISTLKSQEGKVVIRFSPGSKHIPVYADVNETSRQEFIIDTGATLTTIPYSTAKALGIKIDYTNPIRMFYTAGGPKEAPEVTLSSIGIGQWVVYDVKALVVDLPHQPNKGLLGLNFLNHFHMNLNADQGILTLGPR